MPKTAQMPKKKKTPFLSLDGDVVKSLGAMSLGEKVTITAEIEPTALDSGENEYMYEGDQKTPRARFKIHSLKRTNAPKKGKPSKNGRY